MNLLTNSLVLRAALLLFGATVAFGLGLFLMRQLRKTHQPTEQQVLDLQLVTQDWQQLGSKFRTGERKIT